MKRESMLSKALIHAASIGFSVDEDGNLFRDGIKKSTHVKGLYLCFSMRFEGRPREIAVHRLQAYQKYGESIFVKGIECRHKNNNSKDNSYENILIGTNHENHMDMPAKQRHEKAISASHLNRRFTDEEVMSIVNDRRGGMKYKDLCEKYKTGKGTLSYLFNSALYTPR